MAIKVPFFYNIWIIRYNMRDNVQYSTLSPLQLHCNYSLCDISENIAVRDCFFSQDLINGQWKIFL